MATDDNEEGFTGYRYLLDAKNSRQYAVRYVGGDPVKPILPFALDERENGFKAGETVFAFDDEIERKLEGGKISFHATTFQLDIGPDAQPVGGNRAGVVYEAVLRPNMAGGIDVSYILSKDSELSLTQRGFSDDFPKSFRHTIEPESPALSRDPMGRLIIDPKIISLLPFPPHQPDGLAVVARMSVEKAPDNVAVAPREKDKVTGKAKDDFNNKGSTAVVPKPPQKLKVPDSAIEGVIKQFCVDLTDLAARGKLDPVVGRDTETDQAMKVLSRRKQASLCFTGDAGVGKTAMFSGIAQRIADGEGVPESLEGARVLQLDLQAMNAGAKFRGQFEEKLKPLIDGLQEREGMLRGRKIIIAIDEIHSQLTAGKAEGGTDSANMMKPFLTSKGISVMGTTTSEEYRKHIEKDGALASRFEQLPLASPDEASTKVILQKIWPLIRDHHKLAEDLADEDFDYIISMTNRYAPNESQPRKGEKALDMAAASARFRGSNVIEREDMISAIAQMSKLSVDFLGQSDHERFLKMETELPKLVLGQPGVQRVVDGLIGSRVGLTDPDQPWGCFVLQGPTGTGKTELCKALSRYLFGTDEALIKLDMSEYSEKHTVSRLIGAPPGFVGFDSAEPALTERIRQRPYSILLLDEVEKAHPDVFNVLLSVLNDGKMTDNQGKTVLFNNVIIVMTTNLGARQALTGGMSFGGSADNDDPKAVEARLATVYEKARKDFFRPEMVNRIEELGGFVTFIPLSQTVITNLVGRELDKASRRLSDTTRAGLKNVTLEVSQEIRDQLAKDGYNPSMGARPMRKVVREKIQNPLAKWLLGNKEKLAAFVAANGSAKLVIDSLETFEPKMVPGNAPAPAATNDNVILVSEDKKKFAPKP